MYTYKRITCENISYRIFTEVLDNMKRCPLDGVESLWYYCLSWYTHVHSELNNENMPPTTKYMLRNLIISCKSAADAYGHGLYTNGT